MFGRILFQLYAGFVGKRLQEGVGWERRWCKIAGKNSGTFSKGNKRPVNAIATIAIINIILSKKNCCLSLLVTFALVTETASLTAQIPATISRVSLDLATEAPHFSH